MRYRRFFTLSMKVNKTSALTFSPKCACSTLERALGSRDMTKATKHNKFLQKTSGYFSQLVLAIFLENFIGCIFFPDKYVNRRGIKHFKGRKLRGFYSCIFFRSRQSFTRSETIASLKFLSALNFMSEKLSFCHFKTPELQFNAQ